MSLNVLKGLPECHLYFFQIWFRSEVYFLLALSAIASLWPRQ